MEIKYLVLAGSLLSISVAHAIETYQFTPTKSANASSINSQAEVEPQLGTGYSSDQQKYVQNCLRMGDISYQGTSRSVINLSDQITYDKLQQSLNVNVSTKVGFGPFSAKAEANFARSVQDDKYARSFIYYESIQLAKPTYNIPSDVKEANESLNGLGKSYTNDPQLFRRYCGDQFVYQYSPSANLYVAVKLKFHSHEDKTKFNSVAGLSTPIGSITSTIQRAVNEKHVQGSVNFYAFQIGGTPEQLAKILNGDPKTGTAPVLQCSFDKLDKCNQTLNEIIKYAADSQYGLPSQIKAEPNGMPSATAGKADFVLVPYGAAAVTIQSESEVTPAIEDAREKIGEAYLTTLKQVDQFNDILTTGLDMPADSYEQLQLMQSDALFNKSLLESASNYCYAYDISKCATQSGIYLDKTKPITFGFKQWLMIIDPYKTTPASYILVREIPAGAWGNVVTKYISGARYYIWQDGKISSRWAAVNMQQFNLDYIVIGAKNHETINMTSTNGDVYSGKFNNAGISASNTHMSI